MADSQSTRDDRKERIVQEANNVRKALQDLLSEYANCAGQPMKSAMLESAIDAMIIKNKDLKRQLRKAVVDHVSDCYIQTTMPLLVLIEGKGFIFLGFWYFGCIVFLWNFFYWLIFLGKKKAFVGSRTVFR